MIKILLVEKNLIFSNTLVNLLNQDEQLNVVGSCKIGNEIIPFLNTNSVDVIVIDPNQSNGFVITVQLTKEFPTIKVIGFSGDGQNSKNRMLEYGACSYLSKYDTTLKELSAEIKKCFSEIG